MKWLLYIIAAVTLAAFVQATPLPLCNYAEHQELNPIGQNCTFISPYQRSCDRYEIYNETGGEVVGDTILSNLTDEVYYLNFTNTSAVGTFIIVFKAGSPSEKSCGLPLIFHIGARGDEQMLNAMLILIPLIFSALLMAGAFLLSREEHGIFRQILFIASFGMIFPALRFAFVAQQTYLGNAELDAGLTGFLWVAIFVVFWVLAYFIYYFLAKLFEFMTRRREEKYEG